MSPGGTNKQMLGPRTHIALLTADVCLNHTQACSSPEQSILSGVSLARWRHDDGTGPHEAGQGRPPRRLVPQRPPAPPRPSRRRPRRRAGRRSPCARLLLVSGGGGVLSGGGGEAPRLRNWVSVADAPYCRSDLQWWTVHRPGWRLHNSLPQRCRHHGTHETCRSQLRKRATLQIVGFQHTLRNLCDVGTSALVLASAFAVTCHCTSCLLCYLRGCWAASVRQRARLVSGEVLPGRAGLLRTPEPAHTSSQRGATHLQQHTRSQDAPTRRRSPAHLDSGMAAKQLVGVLLAAMAATAAALSQSTEPLLIADG